MLLHCNTTLSIKMKDTTSFYCNLDYLLVPVKMYDLAHVVKNGLKPFKPPTRTCIEVEPLLEPEACGVYSVAIFKQWRSKSMSELKIENIDPETEVVLKLDKSVVLYVPFYFNKNENKGRMTLSNTLPSHSESNTSIWRYDVVRNIETIQLNEVIFDDKIDSSFIKEIWYFTKDRVPSLLYDEHYKVKMVNNYSKTLL